ncbi:MAG: nicotinate phosphoribosyltransferase [Deltaproteobacteria bacterium]|nr:nicotinate phosphoribosyltransferase [Deltaproteobacteria bacterium]
MLDALYRHSLALLTDLYQLTMAYGYWKHRVHEREAVFHLYFRKNPFGGGFTVAAGLAQALELLRRFRFDEDDRRYLATLEGNDGKPLFERAFLDYLGQLTLDLDVDGVEEGTVVFPQEPLLRVRGSMIQAQLLETPLLNLINFQTLIATKAARVCSAARGDPVIEFGLRRAQGIDGGLTASRAAYLGGCAATSNVLAGRLFGIPVRGTHAHSWVMFFDGELEAFEAYAEALPNNCVLLVDTYDTLRGVDHAIVVGQHLRRRGFELGGIRLDSGDLAYLSIEARKKLDAAGFPRAVIVGSNDLDEHLIESLKTQEAAIGVWGVGTKLATAYDQPALGGVYKLSGMRDAAGQWHHRIKLSEQAIKVSTPGVQQVRRYERGGEFIADAIWDELGSAFDGATIIDPLDWHRRKIIPDGTPHQELLRPILRRGRAVYDPPPLQASRDRVIAQLSHFHAGIKRFANPHQYPVGLEQGLHRLKEQLISEARDVPPPTPVP